MIPWTNLLSQPIEIKLYTIELILTPRKDAAHRRRTESIDAKRAEEPQSSSWLKQVLQRVLANISLQVNNLVLKYQQQDIALSLTLGVRQKHTITNIHSSLICTRPTKSGKRALIVKMSSSRYVQYTQITSWDRNAKSRTSVSSWIDTKTLKEPDRHQLTNFRCSAEPPLRVRSL